jgi:hypothetical protein
LREPEDLLLDLGGLRKNFVKGVSEDYVTVDCEVKSKENMERENIFYLPQQSPGPAFRLDSGFKE